MAIGDGTQSPAPCPSWNGWRWGSKFQSPSHMVLLVTSPSQGCPGVQSPVISLEYKVTFILEIPKVLGALCQETGSETKYIISYDVTPSNSPSGYMPERTESQVLRYFYTCVNNNIV